MASSENPLAQFTPDWAAVGTGLKPLNEKTAEVLGELPPSMAALTAPHLPTLFGDYPTESGEVPANAIFIAIYSILAIANGYVFFKGWSNGHKFWPMFAMIWFALLMVIGFGVRLKYSDNFMDVSMGITSSVFIQTPIMIMEAINFYFSTRIFTWRHPDAGRSCFQRSYNAVIYSLVIILIIMSILGSVLPTLYFMTPAGWKRWQQCTQAAGILQCVYSINPILNIINAYSAAPGKLGKKIFWGEKPTVSENQPHVRQAHWIQSFGIFHYPVVKKDRENVYHGHNIIPTSASPGGGLVKRHDGHEQTKGFIRTNIMILVVGSLLLLSCSIVKCIALFLTGERGGGDGIPFKNVTLRPYMMFIFYGGVEALINIFWLVVRIDLRFYQPDRQRKKSSGGVVVETLGESDSLEKGQVVYHEESN